MCSDPSRITKGIFKKLSSKGCKLLVACENCSLPLLATINSPVASVFWDSRFVRKDRKFALPVWIVKDFNCDRLGHGWSFGLMSHSSTLSAVRRENIGSKIRLSAPGTSKLSFAIHCKLGSASRSWVCVREFL